MAVDFSEASVTISRILDYGYRFRNIVMNRQRRILGGSEYDRGIITNYKSKIYLTILY